MQRPLGGKACLLGIGFDKFGDPVHQRMFKPFFHRPFAPRQIPHPFLAKPATEPLGDFQHPLGRIVAPVEDDILATLPQIGVDLVINHELPRVDDAHIHPRLNRVIEENRVHRLAHRFIATE